MLNGKRTLGLISDMKTLRDHKNNNHVVKHSKVSAQLFVVFMEVCQ